MLTRAAVSDGRSASIAPLRLTVLPTSQSRKSGTPCQKSAKPRCTTIPRPFEVGGLLSFVGLTDEWDCERTVGEPCAPKPLLIAVRSSRDPPPGEMTPGRRADAADPASDKINCRTQVIAISPPVQTPDRGKERKAGGFDRLRVEHTTRRPTFRVELPVLPDTSTVELHRNSIQGCRERSAKRMKMSPNL